MIFKKWFSEKPTFSEECLVICASEINGVWDYTLFQIRKIDSEDGCYLGWLTQEGEEYGDLNDMHSDMYFLMPLLKSEIKKLK